VRADLCKQSGASDQETDRITEIAVAKIIQVVRDPR
jgi:hypothetical protein